MDLSVAAAYFDDQAVYDSYSSALLFYGQPDLYDSAERDSETGWRRSLSVVPGTPLPARGCISLGTDHFVIGRVVKDYFQGSPIREHLLLHPAEGLVSLASAATFLASGTPTSLHAGRSWLKDRKFETRTSQAYPLYDFFCHESEPAVLGYILKDADNDYYRVAADSVRSGELRTLTAYHLGTTALRSIGYSVAGTTYSSSTNSYTLAASATISAFVEDYRTNYLYLNNAAEDFERSDKVITVLVSAVTDPKTTDRITDSTTTYRVIDRQPDGASAWAIHVRPV